MTSHMTSHMTCKHMTCKHMTSYMTYKHMTSYTTTVITKTNLKNYRTPHTQAKAQPCPALVRSLSASTQSTNTVTLPPNLPQTLTSLREGRTLGGGRDRGGISRLQLARDSSLSPKPTTMVGWSRNFRVLPSALPREEVLPVLLRTPCDGLLLLPCDVDHNRAERMEVARSRASAWRMARVWNPLRCPAVRMGTQNLHQSAGDQPLFLSAPDCVLSDSTHLGHTHLTNSHRRDPG